MSTVLLLVCLASTLFMTGLIWFVQVVHYPLFAEVGPAAFRAYHAAHVRRIGPMVGAVMLAELASAAGLVAWRPAGVPHWLAIGGLSAAAVTWASTALVQVPLHGHLASGFDAARCRSLVRSNWVRTAVWSAHSAIMLAMTALALE